MANGSDSGNGRAAQAALGLAGGIIIGVLTVLAFACSLFASTDRVDGVEVRVVSVERRVDRLEALRDEVRAARTELGETNSLLRSLAGRDDRDR